MDSTSLAQGGGVTGFVRQLVTADSMDDLCKITHQFFQQTLADFEFFDSLGRLVVFRQLDGDDYKVFEGKGPHADTLDEAVIQPGRWPKDLWEDVVSGDPERTVEVSPELLGSTEYPEESVVLHTVPFVVDEEPVGFFILLSSEPLDLPDTFRLLADEFGSTVAEIIQFKLNSWKVRERLETFEILDEFYEKMNRLRDFDETMKYSLETFQTLFDAPDGSIMLYDPDTGELQVEYSTTDMDRDPIVFTLGEGAAGTALEEEEIICIPNAAESKYFESYEEKSDSVKSLACVPLFTPRRKIGVINVSDHSQQQRFSLENVPGIEILQSRVAAALENLINNKKLEKMANTDGLTDIYNRRYMNQRLPVLFEEYVQHDTPFSVILIDVDDFKDINDNYGHTTGDRVLTSFADCLVQHSRPADIVGRYGGDEFIYVMEHSGADDAILQGEHLVESLETISVESEEGEVLNPKASLGLSVASEETGKETLHDVLKQADDQLYRSKESSGVHLSYDPSIT